MSLEGWYYLHTNGELIYKRELGGTAADIRESDFAVGLWPVDPKDRECAWTIIIESLAAGAKKERVFELAKKWNCTDKDAEIYCERIGCKIDVDGDKYCANKIDFINLQEDPAGFGETKIEALADLAKQLGYKPYKMWGASFKDLLKK